MSEQIKDLKDGYLLSENITKDLSDLQKVADIFLAVRKEYEDHDKDKAHIAQLEFEVFSFSIQGGEIKPLYTKTNFSTGESRYFPEINRYIDDDLKYFKSRLDDTSNVVLKARYAHLLWESRAKNIEYARIAIKSYQEIIKSYILEKTPNSDISYSLQTFEVAAALFQISKNSKNGEIQVTDLIVELIEKSHTLANLALFYKLSLLVHEEFKSFLHQKISKLPKYCYELAEKSTDPHLAINILRKGEAFSKQLQVIGKNWQNAIGIQYELLLEDAEKTNSLAAPDFCLSAIDAYQLAGNVNKINDLQEKYESLRKGISLQSFEYEIDRVEFNKVVRGYKELATNLAKGPSNLIYEFISFDENLIPNVREIKEMTKKHTADFPLLFLIPKVSIDQRGHPAKHFDGDEESEQHSFLYSYSIDINLNKSILIEEIIYAGIREGKITTQSLINYLKEKSWLGRNLATSIGSQTVNYSWIYQIIPAIDYYIKELELSIKYPGHQIQSLMPVDSLSMKFEGIFRDLFSFLGIPTFKTKRDKKNRKIIREKDLSGLLGTTKASTYFDENDFQFLNFY